MTSIYTDLSVTHTSNVDIKRLLLVLVTLEMWSELTVT